MNKAKHELIILLLLIIAFSNNSVSQVKFEQILGGTGYDYGHSVIQTKDKGYVFAGSTTSYGNGNSDVYILKTDSLGITLWQKTFGDINIDQAYSIKETSDSGLVIAGFTNSFGSGGYDMYVIRTDKTGNTIWTKTYGGSNWDFAYTIDTTSDGGYIIAGGTYSFGKGDEDMYLVKINSVGDTLWTKTYGGNKEDEARSVKQTIDGGYILTGFTKSLGDIKGDFYTIKTNAIGDTLWTKTIGGNGEDKANSIIQTSDGGYMTVGYSENTFAGRNEGFIVKTNSNGDTLFTKRNGAPNDCEAFDVCESSDGTYVWVGKILISGKYLVWLFKIDMGGGWQFANMYGGSLNNIGQSLKQTTDGGYIVVANTTSFNNHLEDVYLFKTDINGISSGNIVNNATSISDFGSGIKNGSMQIIPNPAPSSSCKLFIPSKEISTILDCQLKIYQINGQLVSEKSYKAIPSLKGFELTIDAGKLINGLYFVELTTNNDKYTGKLIITND